MAFWVGESAQLGSGLVWADGETGRGSQSQPGSPLSLLSLKMDNLHNAPHLTGIVNFAPKVPSEPPTRLQQGAAGQVRGSVRPGHAGTK